jgi:hypothetical protein
MLLTFRRRYNTPCLLASFPAGCKIYRHNDSPDSPSHRSRSPDRPDISTIFRWRPPMDRVPEFRRQNEPPLLVALNNLGTALALLQKPPWLRHPDCAHGMMRLCACTRSRARLSRPGPRGLSSITPNGRPDSGLGRPNSTTGLYATQAHRQRIDDEPNGRIRFPCQISQEGSSSTTPGFEGRAAGARAIIGAFRS